jgi:AcrR family transcriptional regulator
MGVQTKVRVDRDSRREAILDAAAEVFMEVGFAAASMSTIAARVGGSKGTLYNYFKSKEELFEAHVNRHCLWHQEVMDEYLTQDGDIQGALTHLGRSYLRVATSGFGLANFRLVASEAGRAPEIGRAFYEAGPQRSTARLAQFIERATREGRLRACDPVSAAYQFVGLCQNRLLKARLCNYGPEPTEAEIEAEVDAAVRTFMAAFGAGGDPGQDQRR